MTAVRFEVSKDAATYARHMGGVSVLFRTAFQRPFPGQAWEQWYLANPYGSPLAAVGYSDGQVVAHHALVPQRVTGDGGRPLGYFLSMSTMVHPQCRGVRAFLYMVDALHEAARERAAAFVLAFPNSHSAPLFEKLCGYRQILETDLCSWKPRARAAAGIERRDGPWEGRLARQYAHPSDGAYWDWRTRNNRAVASTVDGTLRLVYKVVEPATLMLLDASVQRKGNGAECLAGLVSALGLSEVRLTRRHAAALGIPDAELSSHEGYVVRLCGFPLAGEIPDLRFSLLLSDVF